MGRGFGNLGNAPEVLDESFYQFSRLPLSLNVLVKCENACYVEALFDDTKCVRVHLKTIYGIHLWRLHALKASREQIVWVPFLPLWRDRSLSLSQSKSIRVEGLLVSRFPGYGYGGKFWTHAGDGIYLAL